jgi:spermidine/putrescine transport system permease protein
MRRRPAARFPVGRGWRGRGAFGLALPAAALFLAFVVAPLLFFAAYSFMTAGFFTVSTPVTLDAYRDVLTSGIERTLARNSAITGLSAACATLVLGVPVAYWLRYVAGRAQVPILVMIAGILLASYLVRIFAWRTVLGESGVLNGALISLGIIDEPLGFLLFSRVAVIIAETHVLLPFVIVTFFGALRPLSSEYLETAQDLGANAFMRWRRVILPALAAPAVLNFVLVFVIGASDYVTPQLLGGPSGSQIGVQIANEFKENGDWPSGAATAMLVLVGFAGMYALGMKALRMAKLDRLTWG